MSAFGPDIFDPMPWNRGPGLLRHSGELPWHGVRTRKWSVVSESRHNDARGARDSESGETEEARCILETLRGKRDAFDFIVDTYSARIFTHLFRIVHNREEAEDLTQETFVRAYRFLDRYDAARPFRNWLYTIATNIGLNAVRAQQRRGRRLDIDIEVSIAGPESTVGRASSNEFRDRLAEAVSRLPEKSSLLIHLHYNEQLTIREAAEIVGMSEGAAKVALHRARKMLREWFAGDRET